MKADVCPSPCTARATRTTLLTIFATALGIRWAYAVVLYLFMGDAGLMGVDSIGYLDHAREFADVILAGKIEGWAWIGTTPVMMPLFTWLLTLHVILFGDNAGLSYVLMLGLFDAGTCLLIYAIAATLDRRFAIPSAIVGIFSPTQIVISGQVYPDSPFVFFVALMLFGALRWWQTPSWRYAMITAAGFAFAAWMRVLIVPFAPALVIFLLVATWFAGRLHWRHAIQLGALLLVLVACLAPISLSNAQRYGSWSLTSQGGQHLARWVVPLIWEVNEGKPWVEGYMEMERRAEQRPHPYYENHFEQSRRLTEAAMEELNRIGVGAVAKAWLFGAAINLGTPGIILSPPVALLPRAGFYATPGKNPFEKISNFLFRSDNVLYGWILLSGIAGLAAARLVQLGGFVVLLVHREWVPAMLFAGWCTFILCVNGPVASPKYRLPMEPALTVLTGAGWVLLTRRRTRASSQPS
jgi:4-amino-4-deoxy-L-arabinose transferase-like glycosyltransferase